MTNSALTARLPPDFVRTIVVENYKFFYERDTTRLLTHPIHPVVPASAAPECLLYCRNTTAQGVRISDAVPLPCSRSILHLKRRALLWPPASAVIHASGGNIRVPQPLLCLGDIRPMG